MFRFIHKIIQSHRSKIKKTLGSSSGQVAIILILVVAAALIFYAVTLNFGQISLSKTLTTIASNTSAGILGSNMASYGQQLSETSLRGRRSVCGFTGVLAAIIAIIILIIAITILVTSAGAGAPVTAGLAGLSMMMLVGLALAVVALIIQMAVIQPGISDKWNRVSAVALSIPQQFNEGAIQNALGKAVTDAVNVPDVFDMDSDRVWVPKANLDIRPYADQISRHAVYYTEKRLKAIKVAPAATAIDKFIGDLFDFLYVSADPTESCAGNAALCSGATPPCSDCSGASTETYIDATDWGIHDPTPPGTCGTSECDPCCFPISKTIDGEPFPVRPERCRNELSCAGASTCSGLCTDCSANSTQTYYDSARDAAVLDQCRDFSPYGANYPWVYDFAYENPANLLYSFRELLGKDDEHQQYYKKLPPADPNAVPQNLHVIGEEGFDLEDTYGFYVPPYYSPVPPETRRGIYPFFYKMKNWGVDLNLVDEQLTGTTPIPAPYDFLNVPNQRVCHWCDVRAGAGCPACAGDPPFPHPVEIPQLVLPLDPATLTINTTYFVDGFDPITASANPPLAVDKILTPTNIMARDTFCAQESLYPPPGTADGFWKAGGDQFCSGPDSNPDVNTTWPYELDCPKHQPGVCLDPDGNDLGCRCAAVPATADQFPDDGVDDLVYGLKDFIEWAQKFISDANADLAGFAADFVNWYPDVAEWIEPGPPATQSSVPPCFLCNPTEGILYIWMNEMTAMRDRIQTWVNGTSFAGATCTEVWCVPDGPNAACPLVGQLEYATFDANMNGVQGDVEDIAACLNWNANLPITYADGTPATGNDQKFQACINECNVSGNFVVNKCLFLPRSLIPGVNTQLTNQNALSGMQNCLLNCSNSFCRDSPNMAAAYAAGFIATDPTTVDFEGGSPSICSTWAPGNAWYDEIKARMLLEVCNPAWLGQLNASIPEAVNQVAKFKHRAAFLQGRIAEARNIIDNVLTPAISKFNEFLTGPAAALIQARKGFDPNADTGLPNQAVYGWQDKPRPGDPSGSGKWHIVKVEARIPSICDNRCGTDQVGQDPGWPRIKTRTVSWGAKRCFRLENTGGYVKFRVTRYDEERILGTAFFPNGLPIWRFRSAHPERPQTIAGGANPALLDGTCRSSGVGSGGNSVITTFPDGSDAEGIYDGAFLMNEHINFSDSLGRPSNHDCWKLAHRLLTRGVATETCAQYDWAGRMNFKFVKCQPF